MDNKINYHLNNLLFEIKSILSEEITIVIKQTLLESKSGLQGKSNDILTIDEVASEFKISKSHINKLRELHKDFPVIRIGGSIRFDKNELDKFFRINRLNNKG